MYNVLLIIGRGIGQVMFQNNAFSGVLILIGICCNSWLLALLALTGNIVGVLTAYLLKLSSNNIQDGLYGFNGTLVGIAIGVFLKINLWSILFLVVGAALSTYIYSYFRRQNKLQGYTFPFVFATWVLLVACHYIYPTLLFPSKAAEWCQTADMFHAFSLNLGQVMLQGDSIFSGLFFICAILLNSPTQALYAVLGASVPLLIALFPETDFALFNAGMYGYNSVLCGIAVGGNILTRGRMMGVVSVIILSVVLQEVGVRLGIITLTAPFVFSVWIYVIIKNQYCLIKKKTKSEKYL